MSSKGWCGGFFLRWRRFGRCFRCLSSWGRLLEVQVLQCHIQGHDLDTAHGLEVSEIPQRALTVVLILGGRGRGVLVGQQGRQQQLRHKQAPIGPLGLAGLPLCLGQPRFAQPVKGERIVRQLLTRKKSRDREIKDRLQPGSDRNTLQMTLHGHLSNLSKLPDDTSPHRCYRSL